MDVIKLKEFIYKLSFSCLDAILLLFTTTKNGKTYIYLSLMNFNYKIKFALYKIDSFFVNLT